MTDKKPETVQRLLISKEVKDRWGLIQEEDYPLIMADYTRQILENSKQTNDAVKSIKGWITFFGVLLIIQIIVLIFF